MACNTVISTTLNTKTFDLALLTQTLTDLGYLVEHPRPGVLTFSPKAAYRGWDGTYEKQSLRFNGMDRFSASEVEKKIRQTYTRNVIATTARRQGFKVTTDAADPTVVHVHTDGRQA